MVRRTRLSLSSLLVCALLLAACGGADTGETGADLPSDGGAASDAADAPAGSTEELRIAMPLGDVPTLDPARVRPTPCS